MDKQLTTQQYADLLGVVDSAVRKMIHEGRELPGVVDRTTWGRAHVFIVSQSFIRKQKKTLKKVG